MGEMSWPSVAELGLRPDGGRRADGDDAKNNGPTRRLWRAKTNDGTNDGHGHVLRNVGLDEADDGTGSHRTPELQQLLTEWLATIKEQALKHLSDKGEMDSEALAKALGVTADSAVYLIAQLAKDGKVSLRMRA